MARKAQAELEVNVKQKGENSLDSISAKFVIMSEAAKRVGQTIAEVAERVTDLALGADKFESVKASFKSLAESQGQSADQIIEKMREASFGTINDLELMQKANNALLLGLPVDRFDDMLKVAQGASKATGESMDFMLQSIVTGLGRGSKMILDNLGIVIDTEQAYKKYAETLGKTADKLDDNEKKQAFINEALAVGIKNLNNLGPIQETVNDKWARANAQLENISFSLGKLVIPIFREFLDVTLDIQKDFGSWIQSNDAVVFFQEISLGILTAKEEISRLTLGFGTFIDLLGTVKDAAKDIFDFNPDAAKERFQQFANQRKDALAKAETEAANARLRIIQDFGKLQIKAEEKRLADEEKAASASEKKKQVAIVEVKKQALQEFSEFEGSTREDSLSKQILASIKFAEEDRRIREENIEAIARHHQEQMAIAGKFTEDTIRGGFQGMARSLVSSMTEDLLPGFGAAASAMFDLLAQDTEAFLATLNQMFSSEFITNILTNLAVLVEKLPELIVEMVNGLVDNLPDIIQRLITALISNAPDIAIALLEVMQKVFLDPKFLLELIVAIVNGFLEAIPRFGQGAAKEFVNSLGDQVSDMAEHFGKAISDGWKKAIEGTSDIGKKVGDIGKKVGLRKEGGLFENTGTPLDFFNTGGLIKRYAVGGAVDNKLAAVTEGEFIVNRESTKRNLPLLEQINNGGNGGMGTMINLVINGGLLGDETSARQLALAIDEELYKLRMGSESRAFDKGVF